MCAFTRVFVSLCVNLPTSHHAEYFLHCITLHLVDAFIQSDLQLFTVDRRYIGYSPWSSVGLVALLMGTSAMECGREWKGGIQTGNPLI